MWMRVWDLKRERETGAKPQDKLFTYTTIDNQALLLNSSYNMDFSLLYLGKSHSTLVKVKVKTEVAVTWCMGLDGYIEKHSNSPRHHGRM
jgi:hypothetical protein